MRDMSHVTYNVSPVLVTCHLHKKATATDPPPTNSPTMQGIIKTVEVSQYYRYNLRPEVPSPPGSGIYRRGRTDIETNRLYRPRGQFSENVN